MRIASRSACPKVNRKFELKGRWCQLVIHAFMLRAAGHFRFSFYQSTPWLFAGKNRRLHLDVLKKNAKPDSLWGKVLFRPGAGAKGEDKGGGEE